MNDIDESGHHTFLTRARPFEPPAGTGCGHIAPTRRTRAPEHRHSGAVDGRRRPFARSLGEHPPLAVSDPAVPDPAVSDEVRRGAEQALRLLFEVLDSRRPAEKMGPLFAPNVIESVKTIVRTRPPGLRLGTASIRRVHIATSSANAAEIFGTYARGPRVFAVAARIEYRSGARRTGWTVTSLRVG